MVNACCVQEFSITVSNVQTETLALRVFLIFCQATVNAKLVVSGCLIASPVKTILRDATLALRATMCNQQMVLVLFVPNLTLTAKSVLMMLNVLNAVLVSLWTLRINVILASLIVMNVISKIPALPASQAISGTQTARNVKTVLLLFIIVWFAKKERHVSNVKLILYLCPTILANFVKIWLMGVLLALIIKHARNVQQIKS